MTQKPTIVEFVQKQIAAIEAALPPGKTVTVDRDTATGSWKQLLALLEKDS